MITANEIRVGNILNSDTHNAIFKVVNIDIDRNYDTISGIPLSEEILLKVGFEKEISNDDEERLMYSIQISNNTSLYFDRHKDWIRSDIYIEWYLSHEWNNNHFKNDLGWNNPKHLHQLQNLYFSLTGEELDVSKLI